MRKKLLLADDSITIQKVVELTFPSDEFEVVTAGNGRIAVDKAMTFLPDVVLCDVIMPQLDGYQVCEALRLQGVTTSMGELSGCVPAWLTRVYNAMCHPKALEDASFLLLQVPEAEIPRLVALLGEKRSSEIGLVE